MIASENFVPRAVLQAQGSVLTNKYAEGYPGRRYYGGCEQVDIAETIAIDRAKALFGAEHANVQPHSGATANAAVLHALINAGDKILGLELAHGGHLTHGMKINFSGKLYEVGAYGVDPRDLPRRHGRRPREGARAASRRDHRRLVRLPAPARLRGVPVHRRRGRRQALGRHGALRRPGRRGPAPEPGAALRRRLLHRAQDDRRPALGLHPVPRGVRQEDRLRRVPGPAGRPAHARDRRQGRRVQGRRHRGVQGPPAAHARRRPDHRRAADRAGRRRRPASPSSPAAPTCTSCSSTCGTPTSTASRPRTSCTRPASRSTATRCRSTRAPRASPPACASARRRWPPRGFGDAEFTEVADIIATALINGASTDLDALKARVLKLTDGFPLYAGLQQY